MGVHKRARTYAYVDAFTRRVANDLCIPLITNVHCTVLSDDHSFIRPTCALRYCQRQKHSRHACTGRAETRRASSRRVYAIFGAFPPANSEMIFSLRRYFPPAESTYNISERLDRSLRRITIRG